MGYIFAADSRLLVWDYFLSHFHGELQKTHDWHSRVRKVIQNRWFLCQSKGLMRLPISDH